MSGNAPAAENYKHPFLVLPKLPANHRRNNDVSAALFWSDVAHLERREDTVSSNEEIVIGRDRNGKKATKNTDRQANRLEGERYRRV